MPGGDRSGRDCGHVGEKIATTAIAAAATSIASVNRIGQLSIDFLILNHDTSIVMAAELDDATHSRESRRQADARKNHALQSAGIPLVRWNAKSLPDTAAILAALPVKPAAAQVKSS